MTSRHHKWILWTEILLAWLVLVALLYYTYVEFVAAPYIGFKVDAPTGDIEGLYANLSTYELQLGDTLVAVNGRQYADWLPDLHAPLFPPVQTGDILLLDFQRQDVITQVAWPVPGYTAAELEGRTINVWWLGLLFWVTGLATLLLVRPLDTKRRLLAAFLMLTALWLSVGSVSRWGMAESRIIYRMLVILSVPVLLHLHWLFPRPLSKVPTFVQWLGYGATALLALLQWLELIPPGLSIMAFGLALLGSLFLIFIHYFRQPDVRAHVRLLLYALILSILPVAGFSLAFAFGVAPWVARLALLALPLIPGAYFYSIYRFQLGGNEFRANRLIAVYLFVILLGTIIPPVTALLIDESVTSGSAVLLTTLVGVLIALLTVYGFPPFQRLVERWFLAMPLTPVHLIDDYLGRITITLNEESLIQLLRDEVLPSLLIRQSALLRIRNNESTVFYATDSSKIGSMNGNTSHTASDTKDTLLTQEFVADLIANLKHKPVYRLPATQESPAPPWVKLALALQVEGKLSGVWLMGRHDPDDLYSPVEISTLQTLARQTALALANIDQSTQLQALYQASIERQEQERMKMAHLLHDAILNQAAVLYMSLDVAALTPRVNNAYELLKEQIHQLISNLRPPSLDLGLSAALEELAEQLDERAQSKFSLRLTIPTTEVHYPPHIENHIFRIVQQACENAIRHANAHSIQISGTLAVDHVDLVIEDDGIGFITGKPFNLTYLLAHKHFGLVHMMERAEHIRAELALESAPGQGTRVHLTWSGNDHPGT